MAKKMNEYVGAIQVPLVISAKSLKNARKLATRLSKNLGWCHFSAGESAECTGRNKTLFVKVKRKK